MELTPNTTGPGKKIHVPNQARGASAVQTRAVPREPQRVAEGWPLPTASFYGPQVPCWEDARS